MDKGFHYYAVRSLAEKAGFPPEEAQTIAYASQYADDASEHKPMRISGLPSWIGVSRYRGGKLDPICTAHGASSMAVQVWKWAKFYSRAAVQRKILMPFHFLPPRAGTRPERFDFVTSPDSRLARAVVLRAKNRFRTHGTNPQRRDYALVSLGLALHTYADTWAHAGFTGRHNSNENDIEDVRIKRGRKFERVSLWANIASYAAPDVGHSEVLTLPDSVGKHWKAKYANKRGGINRNNVTAFLAAAEAVFEHLAAVAPNPAVSWTSIRPALRRCLAETETWPGAFPGIEYHYTRYDWREGALEGDSVDWDDFDDAKDFARLRFRWTGRDARWFWFHKAAFEQRAFLGNKIPKSWKA